MRAEALRSQTEKQDYDLETAHILRIISNILAMMLLRVSEYVRQYKINEEKVLNRIVDAMKLQVEIDDLAEKIVKDKY